MPLITSRKPFTVQNPYREKRPNTKKIIFLSLEGCVTEEEYFNLIMSIFSKVKSKVQFISIMEDAVHTHHKNRTKEQIRELSKNRPKQLAEKIEIFKNRNKDKYEFEKYPEDEFWIISDVDENWSEKPAAPGRARIAEWNEAVEICEQKGFNYAVSNPLFELWLLLHHSDVTDEDKSFAVTDEHPYEPTSHFEERLRMLSVPIRDKHINENDYRRENIKQAVERAKKLHISTEDKQPKYLATTVYKILEEIIYIDEQ